MITTGFTFCGKHSSQYGIICDPTTRLLLPEKRRTMIDIPGRSGAYMQSDGTYLIREESFHCYFTKPEDKSLADAVRDIAAWLAVDGTLIFDNEPDKKYTAYYTGTVPSIRHLKYGEFDLTFTYNPPFAYTDMKQKIQVIHSSADGVEIPVEGTAPTPCRIIIQNNGNTTIQNIRVTRSII